MKDIDLKLSTNIEAIAADLASFKENFASQLKTFQESDLAYPALTRINNPVTGNPPRKRKNAYAPTIPSQSLPTSALSIAPDSYKAVLKLSSADATSNASVLKEMCLEGKKVPDFQSKASKNGCIDVLFKS